MAKYPKNPERPWTPPGIFTRLDINFRESAVIGIVGAGGIGATLSTSFSRYEYATSGAFLIATFGTLGAIVLAVPVAFFAARNTSPLKGIFRPFALFIIVATRSINSLAWRQVSMILLLLLVTVLLSEWVTAVGRKRLI
jgi:ABC-type phosphate/phosphonate transport system permease subunit